MIAHNIIARLGNHSAKPVVPSVEAFMQIWAGDNDLRV